MGAQVSIKDIDYGLKSIQRGIKKLNGSSTDVGLFGSGGDPDDDMAARAAIHEFGSPSQNIPARPYKRQAFENNLKALSKKIENEYNAFLKRLGKGGSKFILIRVGEWYTGKEKQIFLKGRFLPLKPATIAAKGSSRPLVDTGDMRRRTTHKERMKR